MSDEKKTEVAAPKTAKKPKAKPEPSFEDAMKRLEEIANKLENGQATLDESLTLYEEGISLVRYCNEKLDRAEQKIRILDDNVRPPLEE